MNIFSSFGEEQCKFSVIPYYLNLEISGENCVKKQYLQIRIDRKYSGWSWRTEETSKQKLYDSESIFIV